MSKTLLTKIFLGVVFFVVFFANSVISLDPDFGWHYKMGEYILESGIPPKDPFSYTMPSFPFVDHEWFSNILMYYGYGFGWTFLSAAFALVATLAILIATFPRFKTSYAPFFVLAFLSILPFQGIRVQVVTWFIFSLMMTLVFNDRLWARFRFFIPVGIVLWVNLHGGFAVSLLVLAVYMVLRYLQKKLDSRDIAVFLLSVLATLVNPYGTNIWVEIFAQIGNGNLRWQIAEWLPGLFFLNIPFLVFLAVSGFFVFVYRRYMSVVGVVFFVITFLMGFSSARHIPLFVLVACFVAPEAFDIFLKTLNKEQKKRLRAVWMVFSGLVAFLFGVSLWFLFKNCEMIKNTYPEKAVEYIKKNKTKGKLFSEYSWGGYLIWKLPEQKVFIDGRMPSWRWEGRAGESDYAMRDYTKIVKGEYEEQFKRYGVTRVLIAKKEGKLLGQKIAEAILLMFGKKELEGILIKKLEKDGWKKVFDDGVGIVYERR